METRRKSISRSFAALALMAFLTNGCASLQAIRRGTDPLTPVERLNLGFTYEQEGKLDLALREYQRAESGTMKSNALTYQGNVHVALGDPRKAKRCYRDALKENPDHLAALNNLAYLLVQENESLDEAEKHIRQALSLDPLPREPYEDTLRMVLEAASEK
jgi:tetratricopeptide (TPR) repeat protein